MTYQLQFGELADYAGLFASGAATTLALTAVSTVLGIGIGVLGAAAQDTRAPRLAPLRGLIGAYVEAVRNTPFLVQLFFVFFGLPALGIHIGEVTAAILAMTLNLGAYSVEIVRAGVAAVPRGHHEAAAALALSRAQAWCHVVLPQALAKVFPALVSQIVITLLGSAVVSQISVADLTYAAGYIQSRNFRAFETYFVITLAYLAMALLLRAALNTAGRRLFARGAGGAR
ncbi:amino acid ABC transporter permease [Burkholderia glumae]|uniref:Amino acid ABC transporter permease n=1 Tax=Burkholderia glumae TaxID=337 RepID=A0AAQ0BQ58_BURGL|nr:amino acid ABC transporter permease [Burkholderia glumae]ACR31844.1 Polar amino acid ABC transporter inner membrane subunit [Burkholderia glumae BGR1]AJY62605.1 amino ABC transporter, permease, 3-TM region, His/Glu/Gln/Arg/opine family domain protein [Burkholderia glumae LMG 2196 = ATCC 33617]KHJ60118.1 ABC transporter permease [Burkholderia glumae]MCM2484977.1 amino acid ABC transporter permease [Burkholderia glumae]MCM2495330.1 amino acid ABC transporter permease [Burkholderia glumae]